MQSVDHPVPNTMGGSRWFLCLTDLSYSNAYVATKKCRADTPSVGGWVCGGH